MALHVPLCRRTQFTIQMRQIPYVSGNSSPFHFRIDKKHYLFYYHEITLTNERVYAKKKKRANEL
jgi:hypothetical protein